MGIFDPSVKMGRYQDHEGNLYHVLGRAKNTVTLADFVVYEALFRSPASRYWIIPLSKFREKIRVNGRNVPRFKKVRTKE